MDRLAWLVQEHTLVTGHEPQLVLTWQAVRGPSTEGSTVYGVSFTEYTEVTADSMVDAVARADAQLGPTVPRALRAHVVPMPF
jgi:hypothetical protein